MKVCRRCAHTRRRGEFLQTRCSDSACVRGAQVPSIKCQVSRTDHRLAPFGILSLVTCHFPLARSARPRPRLRRLPDWLCSRPEAEWRSVMRYRSATVAGFHGLPCDCWIDWKEPQERGREITYIAAPRASPNPVHRLTMTEPELFEAGATTGLAVDGGPVSQRGLHAWLECRRSFVRRFERGSASEVGA
jgi:hypothetical protein